MPPGPESTSASDEISAFDDVLRVLADTERRSLLRLLRDREVLSVSRLVTLLADQRDGTVDEERLRIRLEQSHLPKLRGVDLVSVDGEEVRLETLTPAALTILDIDPEERTDSMLDHTSTVPPEPNADTQSPMEKLAEQKRMFSTLVANLPGMAYRCANESGWPMSFVSEGCRELTGYAPGDIESGEISWGEDIIHPADRERVWEAVQEEVEDRDPFELTYRIQRADGTERVVWEQGRAIFENGEVEALEGFITDITERREREQRLEAIFDGTFQFIGLLEPDGTILEANAAALEFGGLNREDVVGELVWETPWWQIDEGTQRDLEEAVQEAATGEFVRYEVTVQGADRTATVDFSLCPITNDAGEVTLLVAEGRDITERVHREEQLESLLDVSTQLVEAGYPPDVCEVAVEAAEQTLGLEIAAIELFDEESGTLQPVARTDAVRDLVDDQPLFGAAEQAPWDVFIEQEGTVYEDISERPGISADATPLDSAIVLPLGSHGVFIAGGTDSDAFDDTDLTLARILAKHTEVSLDSVSREVELRERSESLAEKNERLSQLNALNDVIRDLLQSLLGASSRDEILRAACESLSAVDSYRLAWIGTLDPVTGNVEPDARAGVADGYLDGVTVSATDAGADGEPAGRAFQQEEVVVVNQVRSDPPFEPWRRAALDRDYHSVIAVPLTYEGARHGVLAVYASQPDQFDEFEQSVLTELGEAISYAITAAQRKQALMGEEVVELEFSLHEPDTPLLRCVRDIGGEFSFEGAFQEGDGELSVFFALRGAPPEALETAIQSEPEIADLRVVARRDEDTLYECDLRGSGILSTVFAHGGVPRELTAVDGDVTLVVELPVGRNVRQFTETIEETFPSASLVARRQRDRPIQTAGGFREKLREELTERNLEVVKQAYYSGFFEWPRENSGEEVAEALDISQPTFNRHLRNAQLTLFELLIEDSE